MTTWLKKNLKWDSLAYKIAETIIVNKCLAVFLGIGPLLGINLLFTSEFYTANVVTGHAGILIVTLVMTAFF